MTSVRPGPLFQHWTGMRADRCFCSSETSCFLGLALARWQEVESRVSVFSQEIIDARTKMWEAFTLVAPDW
jgi:hypothetical protein